MMSRQQRRASERDLKKIVERVTPCAVHPHERPKASLVPMEDGRATVRMEACCPEHFEFVMKHIDSARLNGMHVGRVRDGQ